MRLPSPDSSILIHGVFFINQKFMSSSQQASDEAKRAPEQGSITSIAVLPLRNVIVFPNTAMPLIVGRERSMIALKAAMNLNKQIFLMAQKDASVENPRVRDLYSVGTIATVLQLLELPDGTVKILAEGNSRASALSFEESEGCLFCEVLPLPDYTVVEEKRQEADVLLRMLLMKFEKYIHLHKKIPDEMLEAVGSLGSYGRITDTIAAHLPITIQEKQKILEKLIPMERMRFLLKLLEIQIEILKMDKSINKKVKKQLEQGQREYYLNEKIKAIQKELVGFEDGGGSEVDQLEKKIKTSGMTDEAQEKARSELKRLKMMHPTSAEATMCRHYIDWLLLVPWKARSRTSKSLRKAQKLLDEDHYGLKKIKERILEFLAVQHRVKKIKGPILCLVGPPGVGKTSLGKSIGSATGREFCRLSLGGVRDEADIRGHRRTYIGSMPGRIIQKFSKIKVKNPLFMLDEIDKMTHDLRGDPAAALLEVLDPEQNYAFNDHYLEVDYDLSEAMFIATSNSMNIPPALLDRMEVIRIPGYTEDEKMHIAKEHLVPKQIKENGLEVQELQISSNALLDIIRYYTREAGVRGLEREISKICRKVVHKILLKQQETSSPKKTPRSSQKKIEPLKISVGPKMLEGYLGVRKFQYGLAEAHDQIGQVTGLAWTEVGGELLSIEASTMAGKGKSTYTGRLGDIMQESIQAALTVVRTRAAALNIPPDFYEKKDIHIHVPEGATPKDGPSAGIGMCTALVSTLTGIAVRADVAMTGEITLRGEVLPIGGLKEKLLAALRGGIKLVIIPKENEKDIKEIPDKVKNALDIRPVRWIDDVWGIALKTLPHAEKSEND